MAEKRKSLTKKTRFEVFKRDNFTCQYCGKKSPDVILEVDHISPIVDGGDNDIMNLLTSCFDCNRGKGKRALTDDQVIVQQREQLEELNKKREQMKMMVEWKRELINLDNEQVDIINDILEAETGATLNDFGRKNMKKEIKKYGLDEIIECLNIAISQYTEPSKIIDYTPKICYNRRRTKSDPSYEYKSRICSIYKTAFTHRFDRIKRFTNDHIHNENDYYEVTNIINDSRNYTMFWETVNRTYEGDY